MYAEIISFVISYIILIWTVFSVSSAILHSEIVREWKDAWIKYWSQTKHFKKLQYYGICQLCLSMPISLILEWLFLPYFGIIKYVLFAISISGASWLLGSLALFLQQGKYAFEQYSKYREQEFRQKRDDLK